VLIHVRYLDDGYDMVKNNILDTLIESNKVVEFKRASGWVKIGIDPIRKTKRDHTTH
jgi:hypothetical protein